MTSPRGLPIPTIDVDAREVRAVRRLSVGLFGLPTEGYNLQVAGKALFVDIEAVTFEVDSLTVNGNITAGGDVTAGDDVIAGDDVVAGGDLHVSGAANITGNLDVNGSADIANALIVGLHVFMDFLRLAEKAAAPGAPVDGMLAYADGATWNPGDGEGLYVREAGAWKHLALLSDVPSVPAVVGFSVGTFWYEDPPASSASVLRLSPLLTGSNADNSWLASRAGKIIGLSAWMTEDRTAGDITFVVTKNGVDTALTAAIDGTNVRRHYAVHAGIAFVAGDTIGVKWTTNAWAPTTADARAFVDVRFD